MKYEDILKKAIEKAVQNGWNESDAYDAEVTGRQFYFDHEFAKAFWGEEAVHVCGEIHEFCSPKHKNTCFYERWAWELRQLVLAEDRLKYIEKFL